MSFKLGQLPTGGGSQAAAQAFLAHTAKLQGTTSNSPYLGGGGVNPRGG